ncbi:hypothetical protein RI367_000486 [Sorochytrium milnesiophthora]
MLTQSLLLLLALLLSTALGRGMTPTAQMQSTAAFTLQMLLGNDPLVEAATTAVLADASGTLAEYVLHAEWDPPYQFAVFNKQLRDLTFAASDHCVHGSDSHDCRKAISKLISAIKLYNQ